MGSSSFSLVSPASAALCSTFSGRNTCSEGSSLTCSVAVAAPPVGGTASAVAPVSSVLACEEVAGGAAGGELATV
eukprot:13024019-Alexandrium_andersonii.AAC.1